MPVTLFSGDNDLEIGEAVAAVRGRFEAADVVTLEGGSGPLGPLSEASRTAGLFDPERLVIVHHLDQRFKGNRKTGGDLEEVREILARVAPTTTLLLVCPGMGTSHPLEDAVRQVGGAVRALTTPRKQDLARWVEKRAKTHDASIEGQAAALLAELVGGNPIALDSELEKLATYAPPDGTITTAMVDELVGAVPQESIFALVDAVAAGNRASAFRLLHEQLEQASSTPIDVALYLIRMLARQMRILLRIRLLQEAGRNNSQIIGELKIQRYFADRYFRQAQRLSRGRLILAFEQLAALEQGLKTGKAEPAAGLDLLFADLCA